MVAERDDLDVAKARELYERSREVFDHPIARYLAETVKTKHEAKDLDHYLCEHGWSGEVARAVRSLALLRLGNATMYRDLSDGLSLSPLSMASFTKADDMDIPNLWDQESWKMGSDSLDISNWPRLMRSIAWSGEDAQKIETTSLFHSGGSIIDVIGQTYRYYLTGSSRAAIVIAEGQTKKLIPEFYCNPERDTPTEGLTIRYFGIVRVHHADQRPRFMNVVSVEKARAEDEKPRPQERLLLVVPADCGPRYKSNPGFVVYQRSLTYVHGNWRDVDDFTISLEAGFNLTHQDGGWRLFACNFNQYLGTPADLPSVKLSYHHGTHWTGHNARKYPTFTEAAAEQMLRSEFLRLIAANRSAEDDNKLLGDYLFTHPETDLLDLLAPLA